MPLHEEIARVYIHHGVIVGAPKRYKNRRKRNHVSGRRCSGLVDYGGCCVPHTWVVFGNNCVYDPVYSEPCTVYYELSAPTDKKLGVYNENVHPFDVVLYESLFAKINTRS